MIEATTTITGTQLQL